MKEILTLAIAALALLYNGELLAKEISNDKDIQESFTLVIKNKFPENTRNGYSLNTIAFKEIQHERKVEELTEEFLNEKRSLKDCDIKTLSYCYFEKSGRVLKYYPLSGGFKWRDQGYRNNGWPINIVPGSNEEELKKIKKEALNHIEKLKVISKSDEIYFDRILKDTVTSGKIGNNDTKTRVFSVIVKFGRKINGTKIIGGSYIDIHLGKDMQLIGVDILWREINKIKKVYELDKGNSVKSLKGNLYKMLEESNCDIRNIYSENAEVITVSYPMEYKVEEVANWISVPIEIMCLDGETIKKSTEKSIVYGELFDKTELEGPMLYGYGGEENDLNSSLIENSKLKKRPSYLSVENAP